jgi:hypothetical protein
MAKPATTARSSPRQRRWKIADARSVLAALAASELSLPELASREGLQPQRLRRWQRRLAREVRRPARARRPASPAVPAPPAVTELRPSPSLRPVEPIEIVLGSGVILRVAATIDPAAPGRVVTATSGG